MYYPCACIFSNVFMILALKMRAFMIYSHVAFGFPFFSESKETVSTGSLSHFAPTVWAKVFVIGHDVVVSRNATSP